MRRKLLNLAQICLSVVTGDNFLCRVRQLEICGRATLGGGYSGELVHTCCLATTLPHPTYIMFYRSHFFNQLIVSVTHIIPFMLSCGVVMEAWQSCHLTTDWRHTNDTGSLRGSEVQKYTCNCCFWKSQRLPLLASSIGNLGHQKVENNILINYRFSKSCMFTHPADRATLVFISSPTAHYPSSSVQLS